MISKPVHQLFKVQTNLTINLFEFTNNVKISKTFNNGTVVAVKYKNIVVDYNNIFKTKTSFKNACHIVMFYNDKSIPIKITSVGNFQIIGVSEDEIEKIVCKLYTIFIKLNNKLSKENLFISNVPPCFNFVIIPILKNYVIELDCSKMFEKGINNIIEKFINHNFICYKLPNDHAITIKSVDDSNFLVKHISLMNGCITRDYIIYENIKKTKYISIRVYTSKNKLNKINISGVNDISIIKCMNIFQQVYLEF